MSTKPIAQTTRVHYESILTINEFLKMGNALPLSAVWTIDLRKSYPFIDGASTAVSWWILQKKLSSTTESDKWDFEYVHCSPKSYNKLKLLEKSIV